MASLINRSCHCVALSNKRKSNVSVIISRLDRLDGAHTYCSQEKQTMELQTLDVERNSGYNKAMQIEYDFKKVNIRSSGDKP